MCLGMTDITPMNAAWLPFLFTFVPAAAPSSANALPTQPPG